MIIHILDKLITLLTFPGVIVHEIAHRFFCDITKVPVYSVSYFDLSSSNPGTVSHKQTFVLKKAFLISIGPLIINTFGCILLTLPYMISYDIVGYGIKIVYLFLAWLGFSMGIHALPSKQDINNILKVLKRPRKKAVPYIIKITLAFLNLAHLLRYVGYDFWYAYFTSKIILFIL